MYTIIVKGNPKYTNNKIAKDYYREIEAFLLANGIKKVDFDPGEDFTCPDKSADFFIGHSRGAGRVRCMSSGEEWRFLQFGDPDGVIHPKDLEWHQRPVGNPPKEHFQFTDEQKEAILNLISKVITKKKSIRPSQESFPSLQW